MGRNRLMTMVSELERMATEEPEAPMISTGPDDPLMARLREVHGQCGRPDVAVELLGQKRFVVDR